MNLGLVFSHPLAGTLFDSNIIRHNGGKRMTSLLVLNAILSTGIVIVIVGMLGLAIKHDVSIGCAEVACRAGPIRDFADIALARLGRVSTGYRARRRVT